MTTPSRQELETAAKELLKEALHRASTFMLQFVSLPDHATVIVATSKMDDLLGAAIRTRLVPCPEKNDDFLDSERGLGTFSNRIAMAHRIGLIDATLARALHIFRKMRNAFAHAYEGQTLEMSPHKERVAELASDFDVMPNLVRLRKTFREQMPQIGITRVHFLIAATDVIAKCELAITIARRIDDNAARTVKYP